MVNIFENLFYKRRLLFRGYQEEYDWRDPSHDEYHFKWIDKTAINSEYVELYYDRIIESVGQKAANARLEHPDCSLGLVLSDDEDELAAHVWALHPSSEPIWHDKYRVETDEVFLFNGHVFEKHRRKGAFTFMHFNSVNRVFDNGYDKFAAVLEESNEPIRSAYDKFGWSHDGYNNLVKLFGINIFATISDDNRDLVVFVPTLDQLP